MIKTIQRSFIVILLALSILSTHGARVIFRQSEALLEKPMNPDFGPTTDVAVSNIITAPHHCQSGFILDDRKLCRRVVIEHNK